MGVVGWYAFHAGNEYGVYAREYKAIVKELNAKNAELTNLKADDEAALKESAAKLAAAESKVSTLVTCKATKAQAKAINAAR